MFVMWLMVGLVYFGSYFSGVFIMLNGFNASSNPLMYLTEWVIAGVSILILFDVFENIKVYFFPFLEEEINKFNIYYSFIYGLVSIYALQILSISFMFFLVYAKGFPFVLIILGSAIPLLICSLWFLKGLFHASEEEKLVRKFDMLEGTEEQEDFLELNNRSYLFNEEGLTIQVLYVFTVLLVLYGVYCIFSALILPNLEYSQALLPSFVFYLYVLLLSAGKRNIMKRLSTDLVFKVEKTLMIGFVYFLGVLFFSSCISLLCMSILGFTKEIIILIPIISITSTLKRVIN